MRNLSLRADDSLDLQIHTVLSDGHWEPPALFAHLEESGFRLVAISDHDTCEHVAELQRLGAEHGVIVLPAVEVTTEWHGASAHLLCYASDGFHGALPALTAETVDRQLDNTRAVHQELLRRGYTFPRQMITLGSQEQPLWPIDNARLLLDHGYVPDLASALSAISEAGYKQIRAPLVEAVSAARADGALAVIAHPGRGGGEIHRYDVEELTRLLDEVPLDGIEVYYPTHTQEQISAYRLLAANRGLLVSAGSDSHGPRQRLPIPYPASTVVDLLNRCGIAVSFDS